MEGAASELYRVGCMQVEARDDNVCATALWRPARDGVGEANVAQASRDKHQGCLVIQQHLDKEVLRVGVCWHWRFHLHRGGARVLGRASG